MFSFFSSSNDFFALLIFFLISFDLTVTSIKEDLNQLLIVSKVEVVSPDTKAPETAQTFEKLTIEVTSATGETCERCWIVTEEVGADQDHPTLCKRCASVVKNME